MTCSSYLNLNTMRINQIGILVLLLCVLTTQIVCHTLHNYAPEHSEYKSSDYSFSYGVKDLHTGDIKHQWEKKDGDVVKGHYSLVEADGSVRSVDYTADKKHGFNAVVKHSGPSVHPIGSNEPVSHSEVIIKPKLVEPKYEYNVVDTAYKDETGHLQIQQEEGEDYEEYVHQPAHEAAHHVSYGPSNFHADSTENESGGITETYVFLPPEDAEQNEERKPQQTATKFQYHNVPNYLTKNTNAHNNRKPNHGEKHAQQEDYEEYEEQQYHQQFQNNNDKKQQQQVPQKELAQSSYQYEYVPENQIRYTAIPLELNLVKSSNHGNLDTSYLKPVEIDLSQYDGKNAQKYKIPAKHQQVSNEIEFKGHTVPPSHQLSQEELDKLAENYYKNEANKLTKPTLETGFQPITSTPKISITNAPLPPQTYVSNKRPKTTPGLRHFATNNNINTNFGVKYSRPRAQVHQSHNHRGHKMISSSLYPVKEDLKSDSHRAELIKLYHAGLNQDALVRYAKHVHEED